MPYRKPKHETNAPDDPGYWDRWLLELARQGELPAAIQKAWVAPILEDHLFPATRGKRRKRGKEIIHQCRAQLLSHEIKRVAADQRIPIFEAKLYVREKRGWH